jgi:hypothetical protein
MAGRRVGPIALARLERYRAILATDLATLELQVKCKKGQPMPRKCPLCYLHKRQFGLVWYQHSDGKLYAFEEGEEIKQ